MYPKHRIGDNLQQDDHKTQSNDFVFALAVILAIIETLGILFNGIILTVYFKYARLRTATNNFILNLAVCNLILALLQLLSSTPSFFQKEWIYSHDLCITYGFLHQYLMTVVVITLAVISFDRFCVITKPVHKLKLMVVTKRRACVLIVTTHIYAFFFTLPLLVGWSKLVPDKHYNTGCYIQSYDASTGSIAYTIILTLFTCLAPLVVTVCCYTKIYRSVRRSSRRCSMHTRTQIFSHKESRMRQKSLYHTRTARMILVVMFFFLLTWAPTRIAGLLISFGYHVSPLALYVCLFMAKSSVIYNAVVYVFINHRFRAAFLHMTFMCRNESRLRFTTDATNASMRNIGDVLQSIVSEQGVSRNSSMKAVSQLHFTTEAAEISQNSSSTDRNSGKELKKVQQARQFLEICCTSIEMVQNQSKISLELKEMSARMSKSPHKPNSNNNYKADISMNQLNISGENFVCDMREEFVEDTGKINYGMSVDEKGFREVKEEILDTTQDRVLFHETIYARLHQENNDDQIKIYETSKTIDNFPNEAIDYESNKVTKAMISSSMHCEFTNSFLYKNEVFNESRSGKDFKKHVVHDIQQLGKVS